MLYEKRFYNLSIKLLVINVDFKLVFHFFFFTFLVYNQILTDI